MRWAGRFKRSKRAQPRLKTPDGSVPGLHSDVRKDYGMAGQKGDRKVEEAVPSSGWGSGVHPPAGCPKGLKLKTKISNGGERLYLLKHEAVGGSRGGQITQVTVTRLNSHWCAVDGPLGNTAAVQRELHVSLVPRISNCQNGDITSNLQRVDLFWGGLTKILVDLLERFVVFCI